MLCTKFWITMSDRGNGYVHPAGLLPGDMVRWYRIDVDGDRNRYLTVVSVRPESTHTYYVHFKDRGEDYYDIIEATDELYVTNMNRYYPPNFFQQSKDQLRSIIDSPAETE